MVFSSVLSSTCLSIKKKALIVELAAQCGRMLLMRIIIQKHLAAHAKVHHRLAIGRGAPLRLVVRRRGLLERREVVEVVGDTIQLLDM